MRSTCTALFVLTCCIHAAPAQEQDSAIRVTQLADGLYNLSVHGSLNFVASIGPDGVLLVDTGRERTAEQVKSTLRDIGGDELRYIINTHIDNDHIGGNGTLRGNATVISHSNSRNRLLQWIADPELDANREFRQKGLADITFEDGLTLFFNGDEIRLFHLPGCHTDEDIVVHFKRANVAYLGDLYFPNSFPYVKSDRGGDVRIMPEKIGLLISKLPEDIRLVVTHGEESTMAELKKTHEMLISTIRIVSAGLKAGSTAEEMKREDVLKDWKSWDSKLLPGRLNRDSWIETVVDSLDN